MTVGEARAGASADVAVWRIPVASDSQLEEIPPKTTSLPCLLSDNRRTKAPTCAEQALKIKVVVAAKVCNGELNVPPSIRQRSRLLLEVDDGTFVLGCMDCWCVREPVHPKFG